MTRRNPTPQAERNIRKPLMNEDYEGFFSAAAERDRRGSRGRPSVEELIKSKNAYRLWRLRSDFKWLQKQYVKLGLNPEDARFLL